MVRIYSETKILCLENCNIVGEKTNLDLFCHLSQNKGNDFYTSCIGMYEITYLTYFVIESICLRSIVVKF